MYQLGTGEIKLKKKEGPLQPKCNNRSVGQVTELF